LKKLSKNFLKMGHLKTLNKNGAVMAIDLTLLEKIVPLFARASVAKHLLLVFLQPL